MGRYEIGPLIHSLEQDLVKLPGVAPLSGASRPVDLMPFVVRTHDGSASLYEQFIDFCSYAIKGEALLSQSHHHSPDFLTSGTFPMDIFNHAARRQLEENVQRVSKNLQSPSTRFRHISKLN